MKPPRNPKHSAGWKSTFQYLKVPYVFIECWTCALKGSEIAVWLYVLRHTVGYSRDWAMLKHSQIASGTYRKDGKRADYGTGLTVGGVRAAISTLKAHNLLYVQAGGNGANRYRCNWSLPATVIAPGNGSACYSGSTPDASAVAPDPDGWQPDTIAKCVGEKLVSAPRRKARVVPIDTV
jgi:hypothetical protein